MIGYAITSLYKGPEYLEAHLLSYSESEHAKIVSIISQLKAKKD
jgi:hypothetical protein